MPAVRGELRPATGVLWREFGGRALVSLPDGSEPLVLSGVAAEVWHLLVGGTSEDRLVADLASRYGTGAATVSRDVSAFLGDLHARGALHDARRAR